MIYDSYHRLYFLCLLVSDLYHITNHSTISLNSVAIYFSYLEWQIASSKSSFKTRFQVF